MGSSARDHSTRSDAALRWRLATSAVERQRILRGMTRDALARAAHVDPKTVRDALNGRRRPTLGTVTQLARVLDLELADVLHFEQPPPIPPRAPRVPEPTSSSEQLRLVG